MSHQQKMEKKQKLKYKFMLPHSFHYWDFSIGTGFKHIVGKMRKKKKSDDR